MQQYVIKQNGEKQLLDRGKIDRMIDYLCHGLKVPVDEVKKEMSFHLDSGIHTRDIQDTLSTLLKDKISLRYPDFQYASSRALMIGVYKSVYGGKTPLPLLDIVKRNIKDGFYTNKILELYTEEEINAFGNEIDYTYNRNIKYIGVRTFIDKYLVGDKDSGRFIETPQEAYMLIAMMAFSDTKNKDDIIDMYHSFNRFEISLPSPIMSGFRTNKDGYASCCVIETGDTKKGISATVTILTDMGALRSGIGLSSANIRGDGMPISNGTIKHTGKIPILRWFEVSINPFSQGARNNSANNINAIWDWDIEKLLTLKSNKSTEENSVKGLTYSVLIPKLLLKRALNDEMWTLFSSHETRLLLDNLYDTELWEETYKNYESNESIKKKQISARELLERYAVEFFETGRIHPIFISNANDGPFKVAIRTTNLCVEIFLPTTPIQSINDTNAELPLCILGNVNMGFCSLDRLKRVCELLVKMGNRVIDMQEYPHEMIRRTMMNGRYLGMGVSDLSHFTAKSKTKFGTDEADAKIKEYIEHFQYWLLVASCKLAKENGEAKWFREKSRYSDGYLKTLNWEYVSEDDIDKLNTDIIQYGLYNLSLSAIPPAGTSGDISGATNGVKVPLSPFYLKATKYGAIPVVVPEFEKYSEYYVFGTEIDNKRYLKTIGVINEFIDQGISVDVDWFETDIEKEGEDVDKFKLFKMIEVLYEADALGLNSLYYSTFNNGDVVIDSGCAGGGCGV
jgi:ribonucleoside-diphosphate reductase alpha chain